MKAAETKHKMMDDCKNFDIEIFNVKFVRYFRNCVYLVRIHVLATILTIANNFVNVFIILIYSFKNEQKRTCEEATCKPGDLKTWKRTFLLFVNRYPFFD